LAWLPSSLLILLYFLSTPKRAGQAASEKPLFGCEKTRAVGDYSQAESRTQGKTAKKAGKMRLFVRQLEMQRDGPVTLEFPQFERLG